MTASASDFFAILPLTPILRGDVLVVLCGEDGEARADMVPTLMRSEAAPIVLLSGGKDEPPRLQGAKRLRGHLMGKGVMPSRILVDDEAQNTREQAVNTVCLAVEKGWQRVILVASPYHAFRAWLSFVQALRDAGKDKDVHVILAPAIHTTTWFTAPTGASALRADLLREERRKIEEYGALGHVASYDDGVDYLKHWEPRS